MLYLSFLGSLLVVLVYALAVPIFFQLLLLIEALFLWLGKVYCLLFCGAAWSQSLSSAVFYGNCWVSSRHFATIPRYHSCKDVCFRLLIHAGVALPLALLSISFSILLCCLIMQCLIVLASFLYLPGHQFLILTWWHSFITLLFLIPFFWWLYFQFCFHWPVHFCLFARMVFAFW